MSINNRISQLTKTFANTSLTDLEPVEEQHLIQAKTDDCFRKSIDLGKEESPIILKAETIGQVVEPSADFLGGPTKLDVLLYDPINKCPIKGLLVRKADEEDVTFTAYAKDDISQSSSLGTISLEIEADRVWIHTMKNTSDSLQGVGKALIQAAKQEAALQHKDRIELLAIGNSHAFYSSCGFLTSVTDKRNLEEAKAIDALLKSACAMSKTSGEKADTAYLGMLEMGLKL